MRWLSFGFRRAAVGGSMMASRACSCGQPSLRASASILARTSGSADGKSDRPSRNAFAYSIVPPTSMGSLPRLCISRMATVASRTKSAAEYGSAGSRISIRVMRHCCAIGCTGLRGADVHAAIDLSRVDRHDFKGNLFGELHCEDTLAAGRWAKQHHCIDRVTHVRRCRRPCAPA